MEVEDSLAFPDLERNAGSKLKSFVISWLARSCDQMGCSEYIICSAKAHVYAIFINFCCTVLYVGTMTS